MTLINFESVAIRGVAMSDLRQAAEDRRDAEGRITAALERCARSGVNLKNMCLFSGMSGHDILALLPLSLADEVREQNPLPSPLE